MLDSARGRALGSDLFARRRALRTVAPSARRTAPLRRLLDAHPRAAAWRCGRGASCTAERSIAALVSRPSRSFAARRCAVRAICATSSPASFQADPRPSACSWHARGARPRDPHSICAISTLDSTCTALHESTTSRAALRCCRRAAPSARARSGCSVRMSARHRERVIGSAGIIAFLDAARRHPPRLRGSGSLPAGARAYLPDPRSVCRRRFRTMTPASAPGARPKGGATDLPQLLVGIHTSVERGCSCSTLRPRVRRVHDAPDTSSRARPEPWQVAYCQPAAARPAAWREPVLVTSTSISRSCSSRALDGRAVPRIAARLRHRPLSTNPLRGRHWIADLGSRGVGCSLMDGWR